MAALYSPHSADILLVVGPVADVHLRLVQLRGGCRPANLEGGGDFVSRTAILLCQFVGIRRRSTQMCSALSKCGIPYLFQSVSAGRGGWAAQDSRRVGFPRMYRHCRSPSDNPG